MPGEFTGVDSGNRVNLVSYGVIDVTLKDTSGNPLQLASGQTATLEFPLPPNDPGDALMPLWSFDTASGDWIREGDATRDAGAGVYRGTVSHFSPWNCDKGRPEAIAGLWDTDRRGCDRWLPSAQNRTVEKGDAKAP